MKRIKSNSKHLQSANKITQGLLSRYFWKTSNSQNQNIKYESETNEATCIQPSYYKDRNMMPEMDADRLKAVKAKEIEPCDPICGVLYNQYT